MYIVEKYTGEKVYMAPTGAIYDKTAVLRDFPAALTFVHIATTDEAGEVLFALQNLSAMRSQYGIDSSLSEADAITAIQDILNTPAEENTDPTAEERIAAALEYQVMASLPDEETDTTTTEITTDATTTA